MKPTEHGLLADPTLRGLFSVQEVFRYDWVHTFLQGGILTAEAWLLIAKCEELGVCDQATVCSFLKEELNDLWKSPMRSSSSSASSPDVRVPRASRSRQLIRTVRGNW